MCSMAKRGGGKERCCTPVQHRETSYVLVYISVQIADLLRISELNAGPNVHQSKPINNDHYFALCMGRSLSSMMLISASFKQHVS